ncbi:hypothetical protein [Massilia endophytica]|uniref:hypothetical protein n=1 Tax=Massilia endophytica TaxID=2899220 RepID=UPI001E42777A|nr:hypothetical protein [Massilia endophytica]UGQ45073.1 hypothetical protein LSQ66_14865 [Massilia endophytica]
MAIETTAGAGGVILKILGVPVLAGAAATALGFLFMWPKSMREGFVRFTCAITSSFTAGPLLAMAVYAKWPELFDAARHAAAAAHVDPLLGILGVAAPFLLAAALPAWWILGGVFLWFERRRGKDIGEIAHDAAEVVKDVRGAL